MKKKRYLKPATKFIMLKPHNFIAVSEDKIVPENGRTQKDVNYDEGDTEESWIRKSEDIW